METTEIFTKEKLAALSPRLFILGLVISFLLIWNGVCDMIFGYSPELSGMEYFSPSGWNVVETAGGRPHWMMLMAQTAGWFYPLYALSYFIWWKGMRCAGFWLANVPCAILAYALLMIGGIQHAGWAFLSVLSQAKAVSGVTDPVFYNTAQEFIVEHFFVGDLTALFALSIGPVWHGVAILSGKTLFPRWFILLSPFGVLVLTMLLGVCLPAPIAGIVIVPFGTWYMMIPCLSASLFLKKIESPISNTE